MLSAIKIVSYGIFITAIVLTMVLTGFVHHHSVIHYKPFFGIRKYVKLRLKTRQLLRIRR